MTTGLIEAGLGVQVSAANPQPGLMRRAQADGVPVLYAGADSAAPGKPLPEGTKILCIYVGEPGAGAPDAVHVWSIEEANWYLDPHSELYGGADLRVLPTYVHDYAGDPVADAKNAVGAMEAMGWARDRGRLIFWDAETFVDGPYCAALNLEVRKLGCRLGKYGSQGTVNSNPPVDGGTWMATDTQVDPVELPPGCVGDQWSFGSPWDRSKFSEFVYENCGRGLRHKPK